MGKLKRLISLFRRRTVLLILYNNEIIIAKAHKCDLGWMARWSQSNSGWALLLKDGAILGGSSIITKWMPHKGWEDSELTINQEQPLQQKDNHE